MAGCPKCKAPRVSAAECPRCGVIYARADAAAAATTALLAEPPPPLELGAPERLWGPDPSEEVPLDSSPARQEFWLRVLSVPITLALAWLLMTTDAGRFLGRTFLSMWVHESGHAVTAWFCGYTAFPGPWFTPISGERSVLLALVLAFALGFGAYRAWVAERRALAVTAAGGLVLQLFCTLLLSPTRAQALFIFGGDGGCLVLGAALMASFFVGPQSALHRNGLRWGFLAIGAVSFMDAFEQWWAARSDFDRIPFGESSCAGLSDPSRLQDLYGWSTQRITGSYVVLGVVCLAALAARYAWGLRAARRPG